MDKTLDHMIGTQPEDQDSLWRTLMPLDLVVGKHRDVIRALGTSTITGGTLVHLLTSEVGRNEVIHQFSAGTTEAVAKTAVEAATAKSVASQANGCIRAFLTTGTTHGGISSRYSPCLKMGVKRRSI